MQPAKACLRHQWSMVAVWQFYLHIWFSIAGTPGVGGAVGARPPAPQPHQCLNQMCKGSSAAHQCNMALEHSNDHVTSAKPPIVGDRAAGTSSGSGLASGVPMPPPPPAEPAPVEPAPVEPAPVEPAGELDFSGLDEEVSQWLQKQLSSGASIDQDAVSAWGPQWSNEHVAEARPASIGRTVELWNGG